MRRADGWRQPFFEIDSYRVHVEERVGDDEPPLAEATVKVVTKGTRHIESAEGQGPVGALDNALRKALANDYPELEHISLEDFRVRVLDETTGGSGGSTSEREGASGSPQRQGTGAVVRVLIDTSNGQREWTTVGVSENIIEASWEALVDGYLFGLLHPRGDDEAPSPAAVP
jgi:2-isopropylmalate synthase